MRAVATFVGYTYNKNIKQKFRQLDILLLIIFSRAAHENPTKTVVVLSP